MGSENADDLIDVTVTGQSLSPKRTRIQTDKGEFLIGKDASPVEYLLASLAACLNSTGHQVARDMDIDIERLDVSVEGAYDPAAFLGEETDARAGFQGFDVDIAVDADADADTLQEWLDAVERRCPVSDNLQHRTPVALILSDIIP